MKSKRHVTSPQWENRFRYMQQMRLEAYQRMEILERENMRLRVWRVGLGATVLVMLVVIACQ